MAYQRIVSVNLCIDQMLFLLEEKQHIASVSYLAADPAYSLITDQIDGITLNHGRIEEILPLQPDLVITAEFSHPQLLHFLTHLQLKTFSAPMAWQLDDIGPSLISLGKLLDQEVRAQNIIDEMHARQLAITQSLQGKRKPRAVILAPGGFTHGKNTMKGDLLELAQFENIAATAGIIGHAYLDLETIIRFQPEYIILENETQHRHSLQQRLLEHPALSRALPERKIIDIPPALWACGTPSVIDALAILAAHHPES